MRVPRRSHPQRPSPRRRTLRARPPLAALLVLCILVLAPLPGSAQTIRYGYDDAGRLAWVEDLSGPVPEVAIYVYDGVGNITQILRGQFPDPNAPVGIAGFTPGKGPIGATVTVFGRGFDPNPAQNTLTFNGTPATLTAASPTQLTGTVPAGATSGPLAVTAPAGSGISAQPFTVLVAPAITPSTTALFPRQTQTFTATQPSQWRANNVVNGNATVGTLAPSPDGLSAVYTAPAAVPPSGVVTLTAAHRDNFTLSATAPVEILPSPTTDPLRSPPVSVARAPGTVSASPLMAALVSVTREPTAPAASPLMAPLLAVAREPVVIAVEDPATGQPARFPRGTVNQAVRLRGAGFTGATAVVFNLGAGADANITVNSFTVDSSVQLTATITIAAGAAPGLRVVRVTVGSVPSTAQGTGANVLEVLP